MNSTELSKARMRFERITHTQQEEERHFVRIEDQPVLHERNRRDRLSFLRAFKNAVVPVLEEHLDAAGIHRALEVGCGTGFFAQDLAPEWLKEKLICSDINGYSLSTMKKAGYERDLVQASVYVLPFGQNSLDAVIGYSSFDSFLYLNKAINEVQRILKQGGKMILFQDLVTDVYDPTDELTPPEKRNTVEWYHAMLIDEVKKAGLVIYAGEVNPLYGYGVESIADIQNRVSDFEPVGRDSPIFAFWDRGFHRPPLRTESRESNHISKKTAELGVDEMIERYYQMSFHRDHPARAGDLVSIVKMRYLVAEKP